MGTYPGYPEPVWYAPNGIANVLSLALVNNCHKVTYDSNNKSFTVHTKAKMDKYHESKQGLYYKDADQYENVMNKLNGHTLVQTVKKLREQYTNREYKQATMARQIQASMGNPSLQTFLDIVSNNTIQGVPVTRQDVLNAEHIFGPNIGGLKGKTTNCKPLPVECVLTQIPRELAQRYRKVTLSGDIFYINKMPLLKTRTRVIKFGSVQHYPTTDIKAL